MNRRSGRPHRTIVELWAILLSVTLLLGSMHLVSTALQGGKGIVHETKTDRYVLVQGKAREEVDRGFGRLAYGLELSLLLTVMLTIVAGAMVRLQCGSLRVEELIGRSGGPQILASLFRLAVLVFAVSFLVSGALLITGVRVGSWPAR